MSQQRPAPNPVITFLLWGAFIFLGYQLFFANKGAAANDARSPEEVLAKIVELDQAQNDVPILQELKNYEAKLESAVSIGKVSPEQKPELAMQAFVIAQHASIVVGTKTNDNNKLQTAYNALVDLEKSQRTSPLWKKPFQVAPAEKILEQDAFSGESLLVAAKEKLAESNKSAKVLGLVSGFHMMDWLVKLTGSVPGFSYWFAGLLLAIIVRVAVFPLAQKQFIWGRRMAQLGPYIKEIKEKFTDKKTGQVTDQQAMTMETMELYKKYGMNPFAGCLPMLIQLPLFLIIYQCMLLYRFEFTKGTFLWMQPGAGTFLGVPLAQNLGDRDYIMILVYGISMVATTMLTPVSDPSNAKQQRLMGIGMSVMFSILMFIWPLPSAFTVYWIFTNVLTTAQSLYVYRMPIDPLGPVQTSKGGVIPTISKDKNGKTEAVAPGFFDKLGKGKK